VSVHVSVSRAADVLICAVSGEGPAQWILT
jgi:hypothetical protein